ncbi:MAG: hypothetical protein AB7O97_14955 [Planctomycetota bacterium]
MTNRATWFAALATISLTTAGFAQNVRITNMADVPRAQWVDIAVPLIDGWNMPEMCELAGFTAFKGSTVGLHTQMFHAYVALQANESLVATLNPVTNDPAQMPAFGTSEWIDDDSVAVIPRLRVLDDGVEHRLHSIRFEEIESNRARRVFHLRARIGTTPLVFDEWIYMYSMQDILKFEMTVTNCDPRIPDLSYDFDYMWVEAGEYLSFDYRKVEGLPLPDQQDFWPWHASFGNWFQILSPRRTMGRGEQLFFSGSIFATPEPGRTIGPLNYPVGARPIALTAHDRVSNFYAETRGPALAVSTDWDGKWLGFGLVPEIPAGQANGGWAAANASAAGFRNLLNTVNDVYSQRPRGLSRQAGSTGAQEDFGACKAALAVAVGDPRYLYEAGYSMFEMFGRPFHYREADGSPLRAANHPGLRTWSQIINCRTTLDTLGTICPYPYSWPSNGWSGIDDQHRSQNNFNAQLALTGSYALRQALEDLLQVDLAQQPGFVDSPRGEGRLMAAWANMLLLLDDQQDRTALLAHMGARVQNLMAVWPGRNFVGDPSRPIRAMHIGSSPTFNDAQGNRIPAIVVWEHSIACMGYWAAYRLTGDPRYHDMALEVSRMIVNHCIYQENGQWVACTVVRYLEGAQEGQALPPSAYYDGSPDIQVGISFWEWIFPSVLICRELNRGIDPALVARCDQIIAGIGAPNSWGKAEWWAVLPR